MTTTATTVEQEPAGAQHALRGPWYFAEFFAGIGLMRMGLETRGWTVAFANDIDPLKREMYHAQFADAALHWRSDDVHALNPGSVPAITLATASFPCNDLSLAGARAGLSGAQSSAFWGFTRILRGMGERRPPFVLLENVPGFLTSCGGTDFLSALSELNGLGYSVDAFVLDAACFTPQSRQRLFVVGTMDGPRAPCAYRNGGSGPGDRAADASCTPPARPRLLAEFISRHADICWRLRPVAQPPVRRGHLVDILDPEPTEWWSYERAAYLLNQMSEKHRLVAERMIAGDQYTYGTVFRRIRRSRSMAELRTDGIAGCLRTPRGGSGRQILFKAGCGQYSARLLSPTECARLMGADGYKITVPVNQALFGFGDAVCVPVVQWIASQYLNPIVHHYFKRHGQLRPQIGS